jgi:hypothetical protein
VGLAWGHPADDQSLRSAAGAGCFGAGSHPAVAKSLVCCTGASPDTFDPALASRTRDASVTALYNRIVAFLCAGSRILSNEEGGDVPGEVRAVRGRLQLDVGAVDCFIVEGKGVVVDADKTVGSNPNWLKKNRFRQEFNDWMRAAPVDFVRS